MAKHKLSLRSLVKAYADVPHDCIINALTLDSRSVEPGHCFLAVLGSQSDGRDYIEAAIKKGACAIIAESKGFNVTGLTVPVVLIEDLSAKASALAARFYDYPSRSCRVVGVTGTNAKTSVCYLLAQALQRLEVSAAIIGTIGYGGVDALQQSALTTSDVVSIQRQLRELVDAGFEVVCMEVSSHGLDQHRVDAVEFEVAIFTNLTQDHLDYHGSMQAYAAAKARLFEFNSLAASVVNADDEFGQSLLGCCTNKTFGYGKNAKDLQLSNLRLNSAGLAFDLTKNKHKTTVNSSLIGEFNAMNLSAVVGALVCMGHSTKDVTKALLDCKAPPGRLEKIDSDRTKPTVVVDYAHTPDALEKALTALRAHCQGQLNVVFGCGGDRDKVKRPLMGEIAQSVADKVMLTDDNPRSEAPSAIVADILSGMTQAVSVQHDRSAAIRTMVGQSSYRDWVLIAGKGHETEQVYADKVVSINDREIALSALNGWEGIAA